MPGLLNKLVYNSILSSKSKLNKIKCYMTDYNHLD